MAIKTGSEWTDIKSVMCPAVNGVRREAESVRIHNGTSWVEVWSNLKIMTLLSKNFTTGQGYTRDGGKAYSIDKIMFGSGNGTISGSGSITMYLEGEFVNPTISFYYFGGFMYVVNNMYYLRSAGSISAYHRVKGATSAGTTTIMSSIGETKSGEYLNHDGGDVSKTLTGTYDRLGLTITVSGYTGTFENGFLTIDISNLKFGTQSIGFPTSAEFDYQV
jgi:hypothetical protein